MDQRIALRAAFVCLAVVLSGCMTAEPYRTNMTAQACVPDDEGGLGANPSAECRTTFAEIAESREAGKRFRYDLYFTEFDDQGWATGADKSPQLERVLGELRLRFKGIELPESDCVDKAGDASRQDSRRPEAKRPHRVHLVVFVHGWKHNAKFDDTNVASFRKLLREIAIAECEGAGSRRDVIGIYVGWRGGSLNLPEPLESLSFWDRKSTATDVAQGSSRELFARLDALVDLANGAAKDGTKPVRMMLVGHSFGGHILLTGLGGSVLKNLASYDERIGAAPETPCTDRARAQPDRDGDMIVLVNPAIEGTRYEPLYQIGQSWKDTGCYHAPLLVSITSNADVATKDFFPVGRWFSTFLEKYRTPEEKAADHQTFGQDPRYWTHDLTLASGAAAQETYCEKWSQADSICSIKAELSNQMVFQENLRTKGWNPRDKRQFCAGALLTPMNIADPWRAPILNIRTTADLVKDHNSIYGPRFVSFLRELYMDSLVGDGMYDRLTFDAIKGQCPLKRRDPAPGG